MPLALELRRAFPCGLGVTELVGEGEGETVTVAVSVVVAVAVGVFVAVGVSTAASTVGGGGGTVGVGELQATSMRMRAKRLRVNARGVWDKRGDMFLSVIMIHWPELAAFEWMSALGNL